MPRVLKIGFLGGGGGGVFCQQGKKVMKLDFLRNNKI